jgi:hypothetical protein
MAAGAERRSPGRLTWPNPLTWSQHEEREVMSSDSYSLSARRRRPDRVPGHRRGRAQGPCDDLDWLATWEQSEQRTHRGELEIRSPGWSAVDEAGCHSVTGVVLLGCQVASAGQAQQESLETSVVKDWAAILMPSAMVR